MRIGLSAYTFGMAKHSSNSSDRETAYKVDRGFRGAKAGAAIGIVLGALIVLLFSRWIPENFFGPGVLITAAIFAVVLGLFSPAELSYREFDDDPDNIAPADRVKQIHSETKSRD